MRINKNLSLFAGLLVLVGTVLIFAIQKISPLIGHAAYYCQTFMSTHMIPVPYYLSFIPFGLLFIILAIATIKVVVLCIEMQFLKHKLKGKAIIQSSVQKLIKRLELEDEAIVIRSQKHFAFCLGVRNPKIYISTGLISQLNSREIEAVLRHEQYHLENHDTITQLIASVTQSLFPFLPLIGDMIKKYRIDREIKADKYAVDKLGNSELLISVLRKLLEFPTFKTAAVAAIADQDSLEPRIYSLINKPYTSRQFRLKHLLVTLFSSIIIGVVTVLPVHGEEIHHEDNDIMMLCANGGECMQSCTGQENMKLTGPNASQPFTPVK